MGFLSQKALSFCLASGGDFRSILVRQHLSAPSPMGPLSISHLPRGTHAVTLSLADGSLNSSGESSTISLLVRQCNTLLLSQRKTSRDSFPGAAPAVQPPDGLIWYNSGLCHRVSASFHRGPCAGKIRAPTRALNKNEAGSLAGSVRRAHDS